MVERANEQMFEIYSTTRQSLAIWERWTLLLCWIWKETRAFT
jgi:hypothetical protein